MDTIALLSHSSPLGIVAYRSGVAVTAQQFLSDARHLALRLPDSKHVLNVCADRYHFTVGLAACLMSQRVSLLPSTHTPQVIAQLAAFAPDAFCLTALRHRIAANPVHRSIRVARAARRACAVPRAGAGARARRCD
jgi:uncharacterized integral membrane protein